MMEAMDDDEEGNEEGSEEVDENELNTDMESGSKYSGLVWRYAVSKRRCRTYPRKVYTHCRRYRHRYCHHHLAEDTEETEMEGKDGHCYYRYRTRCYYRINRYRICQ